MPVEWYQRKPNIITEDDDEETQNLKRFNQRLLVDKKPYFFAYVYPTMGKEYRQYISTANRKVLFEFGMTLDELLHKEKIGDLSEDQTQFLHYFYLQRPLSLNPCVMNRICWKIEQAFDGWLTHQAKDVPFDHTILKSDKAYSNTTYRKVKELYELYVKMLERSKTAHKTFKKQSNEQHQLEMMKIRVNFKNEALKLCSNEEELCNMMLDFCYENRKSKRFVWDAFGEQIIENLKTKNKTFSFPVQSPDGDFEFKGLRFKMIEKPLGGEER